MIMKEMMTTESWNDGTVFELLFKIKERETTVRKEIFAGLFFLTYAPNHRTIYSLTRTWFRLDTILCLLLFLGSITNICSKSGIQQGLNFHFFGDLQWWVPVQRLRHHLLIQSLSFRCRLYFMWHICKFTIYCGTTNYRNHILGQFSSSSV